MGCRCVVSFARRSPESGWTSAGLRSLLERELEAHALERVSLSGEEVVLRPESAQPQWRASS